MLDENGEPLIVTHQTGRGGFSTFKTNGHGKTKDTGAWFADLKDNKPAFNNEHEGINIYHVFLNIRNPYIYDAEGRSWNDIGRIWIHDEKGAPIYSNQNGIPFTYEFEAFDYIQSHLHNEQMPYYDKGRKKTRDRYYVERDTRFKTTDDLVRAVRKGEIGYSNHDGVIIKNVEDLGYWDIDDYIIFKPIQVKSKNNRGSFSTSDTDAYHQSVNTRIRRSNDSFLTQEKHEQLAYHGTPNKILGNQFDLKFINTGTEAQTFGWGLYFTNDREYADSYRGHNNTSGNRLEC